MAKTGKTASRRSVEPLPESLLAWYARHARDLPWRRTRDAYAIWVSEVMLQQTQVSTVIPYFERWMRRFPDVTALGRAGEDDVLHAWQGLGYYSRAKRLLAGARVVLERHSGKVPEELLELSRLPGVGRYTAGAIASIAHGKPAPIVDGNVLRVLCRVYGLGGDPKKQPLSARLWTLAEALIPAGRARDFNQALMELGATVCTPKSPSCERCPWRMACVARRDGRVEALPELPRREKPMALQMAAAVVERRGRVLVRRVADDAPRWAGLWQFPSVELARGESAAQALGRLLGKRVSVGERIARVKHSVTRHRITLDVFRCSLSTARKGPELAWVLPERLGELAMPAAHRRIARGLSRARNSEGR